MKKLCYVDTDSFFVYIKTDHIYKDTKGDVQNRSDTSNYELDRPLLKGKKKKDIRLLKDELGGKIMTKVVGLRGKTYGYLKGGSSEGIKAKGTKNGIIKRKLKVKNYKNGLEAT